MKIDRACNSFRRATHGTVVLGIVVGALSAASSRPAPLAVTPFHGQYCASVGPRGWAVIAENAQRSAFGADFSSADGKAMASYAIFAAGGYNTLRGYATPDQAVASNLTRMGTERLRFGTKQQAGPNVFLISYQAAAYQGIAFYQVIPERGGGSMVVMRTAATQTGTWQTRGAEASAVARSLRCQAPNVPAAPDPPGLNPASRRGRSGRSEEGDSQYNRWLEKEYYHNPQTGENFWVSPSSDWVQDGPGGAGYYAPHGNGMVKLESGYSR